MILIYHFIQIFLLLPQRYTLIEKKVWKGLYIWRHPSLGHFRPPLPPSPCHHIIFWHTPNPLDDVIYVQEIAKKVWVTIKSRKEDGLFGSLTSAFKWTTIPDDDSFCFLAMDARKIRPFPALHCNTPLPSTHLSSVIKCHLLATPPSFLADDVIDVQPRSSLLSLHNFWIIQKVVHWLLKIFQLFIKYFDFLKIVHEKSNKLGLSCAKLSTAELATNWLGARYQLARS